MTSLNEVYDAFFALITDDMYMEITEEETRADCRELLEASLPLFEFPDKLIDIVGDSFNVDLSREERNILAYGMLQIWLQRQITSIDVVRQKFSGTDFKLTSQASHLQRLMTLMTNTKNEHRRLQMLHSRRRVGPTGNYESTFDLLAKRMH
mgnify:CR=1 FL=1